MSTLFDVIAWIETKGNCKLMRFEPTVYANISNARSAVQQEIIARIQSVNLCSWGTALMIYSTSFGSTQIMGFNLYADQMQFYEDIATYLSDINFQVARFEGFVQWQGLDVTNDLLASSPAERLMFARKYNGADSYADLIASALTHLNYTVV
jgi:hypothetical protein